MAPDPKAWERHLTLADGKPVYVRAIRPEDEALYGAFVAAVTPEDARFRFLVPIRELSRSLVSYFTHVDYAHAMAFIALDGASGDMLAAARLHNDEANASAEYAIIVRSDIKGRGLGRQLMHLLIDYARGTGLRAIEGKVLYENKAMLHMCRELGFAIASDPRNAAICNVKLSL